MFVLFLSHLYPIIYTIVLRHYNITGIDRYKIELKSILYFVLSHCIYLTSIYLHN